MASLSKEFEKNAGFTKMRTHLKVKTTVGCAVRAILCTHSCYIIIIYCMSLYQPLISLSPWCLRSHLSYSPFKYRLYQHANRRSFASDPLDANICTPIGNPLLFPIPAGIVTHGRPSNVTGTITSIHR